MCWFQPALAAVLFLIIWLSVLMLWHARTTASAVPLGQHSCCRAGSATALLMQGGRVPISISTRVIAQQVTATMPSQQCELHTVASTIRPHLLRACSCRWQHPACLLTYLSASQSCSEGCALHCLTNLGRCVCVYWRVYPIPRAACERAGQAG
jgi:hypothetical protein